MVVKYKLRGEELMDRYEIIIFWSNEDQAFVARGSRTSTAAWLTGIPMKKHSQV